MIKAFYRDRVEDRQEEVVIIGFVRCEDGLHGVTKAIIASGSLGYLSQVALSTLRIPESLR